MTNPHQHKPVYMAEVITAHGGQLTKLYWCRECGTWFAGLSGNRFAQMSPEWTKDRLEKATMGTIEKLPKSAFRKKVLGRGLKDMSEIKSPRFLSQL